MIGESIVAVARRFLFVREVGGSNRGLWVELFQRFTGNAPGDSWCASFVCYVLSIVYRGKAPLVRSASCAELLTDCVQRRYCVSMPRPGDLVFSIDENDHAHHVAICASFDPAHPDFDAIAGNTSEDGTSSNGDGVYEHAVKRARKVYARLPNAA